MSQPFTVPSTIVQEIPRNTPVIRIPDTISGDNVKSIPEWQYKPFTVTDIFHSKIGISIITSIIVFSVLVHMNPPFVQEKGESKIEIRKPNMNTVYTITLVVFCGMLFIPVVPRSIAGNK